MIKYTYTVEGKAADGQTWAVTGVVGVETRGEFHRVPEAALRDGFMKLTQGKAQYGSPGVGCKGPYSINKLVVEEAVG